MLFRYRILAAKMVFYKQLAREINNKIKRLRFSSMQATGSQAKQKSAVDDFFKHHRLTAFDSLSMTTKQALSAYLQSGNVAHRQKQLLEFFKSLDWLSFDEVVALPRSPYKKLSAMDQEMFLTDLKQHYSRKKNKKVAQRSQRQEYQLRVFAYFKEKLSAADKQTLEQLRDYELDRTGKDDNFQHYFKLGSFKKIDEFTALSASDKNQRIKQFKHDVDEYEKNLKKLRQEAEGYYQDYNFDDWCETADARTERNHHSGSRQSKQGSGQRQHSSGRSNNHQRHKKELLSVAQAFRIMELSTTATDSFDVVKRQFRKLTLKVHPDVSGGDLQKMQTLNQAYQCLKHHYAQ